MASYKLPLKSLTFGTQVINYHLDGAFFNEIEHSEVTSGSVDVALTVTRDKEESMELAFVCKGVITVPCDRCLAPMELAVDTAYDLHVTLGDELDDSNDGVLVVPEHWHELDVAPLMRDTVLLSIPLTHSHEDIAQCDATVVAHLSGVIDDDEAAADVDPRWAALGKLKKKEN